MTIRRTLAAALAAAAIAAPAASAQPADMHASTAQAAAQAQQRQDLRGEHARDAALRPRVSEAVNAPGASVVDSQSKSTPVAPGTAHLGRQPEAAPAGDRAGEPPRATTASTGRPSRSASASRCS